MMATEWFPARPILTSCTVTTPALEDEVLCVELVGVELLDAAAVAVELLDFELPPQPATASKMTRAGRAVVHTAVIRPLRWRRASV
jgi:hypothetical protein